MKIIARLMPVVLLACLLGCSQQENTGFFSGTIVADNATSDEELFSVAVNSGKYNDSFGIVIAKASKTKGFCEFRIDDKIKVIWEKRTIANGKKTFTQYEALFDSSKLKDVAPKVKKTEFVFHGGMKWTMKVYSGTKDFKYTFLKEIKSFGAKKLTSSPKPHK